MIGAANRLVATHNRQGNEELSQKATSYEDNKYVQENIIQINKS